MKDCFVDYQHCVNLSCQNDLLLEYISRKRLGIIACEDKIVRIFRFRQKFQIFGSKEMILCMRVLCKKRISHSAYSKLEFTSCNLIFAVHYKISNLYQETHFQMIELIFYTAFFPGTASLICVSFHLDELKSC